MREKEGKIDRLTVGLGFGKKFKPDPRIDVRSSGSDQRFQLNLRVDVRRMLSSLFDANSTR
jgi:hypothetical protein